MSFADDCTRVYSRHGKMAHLLRPGAGPSFGYPAALCRRQPRLFRSWLGTGSQDEYDQAASLPTCGKCEQARRRAMPADRPFPNIAGNFVTGGLQRVAEVPGQPWGPGRPLLPTDGAADFRPRDSARLAPGGPDHRRPGPPEDGAPAAAPTAPARPASQGSGRLPAQAPAAPLRVPVRSGAAPRTRGAESDAAGTERHRTAKYSPRHAAVSRRPVLARWGMRSGWPS